MQLAWRLQWDVVTDDAVDLFTQVMAQRRIQAEREARQREKEMEKLREEREARLEQARKVQVELLRKIQEQAKKTNGATSETEVGRPTNSTRVEDRPASALEWKTHFSGECPRISVLCCECFKDGCFVLGKGDASCDTVPVLLI